MTVARITEADASCMKTVADVMVRHPKLCHENSTVGDVRQLFGDDHVHAVLVMSGTRLLTVIYRTDLGPEAADSAPAARLGRLSGRLIAPTAPADTALQQMIADGRRRLAVLGPDGTLLGLLCLKRSGTGFCSDENVRQRQREHLQQPGHRAGGLARAGPASEASPLPHHSGSLIMAKPGKDHQPASIRPAGDTPLPPAGSGCARRSAWWHGWCAAAARPA